MKAILELEAPKSCRDCKLYHNCRYGYLCVALGRDVFNCACDKVRHPDCPLKIVEEEK